MSSREDLPDLDKSVPSAADETKDEKTINYDDIIDVDIFDQLLDMDDDDNCDFSHTLVNDYFEQAYKKYEDMSKAVEAKDLPNLSKDGHFLKGSSVAIGLKKLKATCEKIQNVGELKDEEEELTEEEALKRIKKLLKDVDSEIKEAEEYFKNFYNAQGASEATG
ncbi:signal transduction histidine kinase [Parasitella parasitica]|nr:signal transduction histidine kinase [Parasitella parasitica]